MVRILAVCGRGIIGAIRPIRAGVFGGRALALSPRASGPRVKRTVPEAVLLLPLESGRLVGHGAVAVVDVGAARAAVRGSRRRGRRAAPPAGLAHRLGTRRTHVAGRRSALVGQPTELDLHRDRGGMAAPDIALADLRDDPVQAGVSRGDPQAEDAAILVLAGEARSLIGRLALRRGEVHRIDLGAGRVEDGEKDARADRLVHGCRVATGTADAAIDGPVVLRVRDLIDQGDGHLGQVARKGHLRIRRKHDRGDDQKRKGCRSLSQGKPPGAGAGNSVKFRATAASRSACS